MNEDTRTIDPGTLLDVALDGELVEVGRQAIHDLLIELRDTKCSDPGRGSGLVIPDSDGKDSSVIRCGPELALKKALLAMADHIKENEGPRKLSGAELIAAERKRQIEEEVFGPNHDEQWKHGELSKAGAVYAQNASDVIRMRSRGLVILMNPCPGWPWSLDWWKPTPYDPTRQLVKAGALIAAEIDRLARLED